MLLELPSEYLDVTDSKMSADPTSVTGATGGSSAPPSNAGRSSAQQMPPPSSSPGPSQTRPKSHNRVWINPNFVEKPQTKESSLTDDEVRAKMGLGNTLTDPTTTSTSNTTPPPNQFGKRPKSTGPTPPPSSRPAQKKRKKGNKKRVVSSAQQRLQHARAVQAESAQTKPSGDPQGSASVEQNEDDEDDDRTRRAKAPAVAKVMGASKTVVDQLERETFDAQPRWLQELAEKRQSKLFPPKPTNMAASLLELADKLTSASEQQICRAAALDIEKAVTALHGQADGRVEGVLEEIHQLNKKFEDAMADASRQSKKQCMEFQSRSFVSEGYVSNTDLLRRLNLVLQDKHGITIPAREVCDLHPLRRKTPGTIIVKFSDRKEGSAFHFLSSPWLLPKNDSAVQMKMYVSLSPYDSNIRDALLWWMHRCTFMRATAALRGYNPDKVVPPSKWVMGVKTSPTPGLVEAKFPNPAKGKKAYKFEVVATYTQLKALMGQTSLDRYLLGGDSDRWDLPKRKERDLEKEKEKKEKKKAGVCTEEEKGEEGMRDDSLPESAEQIMPDEDVEEEDEDDEDDEEGDDETSKNAKEAERALQMDTSNSNE